VSINLEPIKGQLAKDIGGYICLHRDDMAGLISEVEHLRGERADVVAWLRDDAEDYSRDVNLHHPARALWDAAICIERGEHRREEEP
jgi:hypothetical protein